MAGITTITAVLHHTLLPENLFALSYNVYAF
jgi:hypothetical protein